MNTIAKTGLITGCVLIADAGYLAIRRAINVAKANKTIREMKPIEGGIRLANQDIPENCREFSRDAISEMLSIGELIYLKPTEHFGKKYPVSAVFVDFEAISTLLSTITFTLTVAKYSRTQLYNRLFASVAPQVIAAGGAFTTKFTTMARLGIFKPDSKAEPKFGETTTGILILIDKQMMKLLSDKELEAVLHHEYYHAMKHGGVMDTIISMSDVDVKLATDFFLQDSGVLTNIVEEIEADGFAKLHTGVDMRQSLKKILDQYLPEAMDGDFPKILSNLLYLVVRLQGR